MERKPADKGCYRSKKKDNWEEVEKLAFGELGIKPLDFYSMSHREFMLTVEGYQEKKIDGYRQTRMLMFTMVKIWADKGPKTPEELWQLPGDEQKTISEDEIKALTERFAKLRNV